MHVAMMLAGLLLIWPCIMRAGPSWGYSPKLHASSF